MPNWKTPRGANCKKKRALPRPIWNNFIRLAQLRGWSVTVAYTALMAYQECAAHIETVSDAKWWEFEALNEMPLAFDHREIIQAARERLRQKALYSIVLA